MGENIKKRIDQTRKRQRKKMQPNKMKYIMHVIIMRNNSRCANLLAVLNPRESHLHTVGSKVERHERDFGWFLFTLSQRINSSHAENFLKPIG